MHGKQSTEASSVHLCGARTPMQLLAYLTMKGRTGIKSKENTQPQSAVLSTWTRVDDKSRCFKITKDGGPAWSRVIRRITSDSNTGKILDDWDVCSDPDRHRFGRVPDGPRSIRSEFIYRGDPVPPRDTIEVQVSQIAPENVSPKTPQNVNSTSNVTSPHPDFMSALGLWPYEKKTIPEQEEQVLDDLNESRRTATGNIVGYARGRLKSITETTRREQSLAHVPDPPIHETHDLVDVEHEDGVEVLKVWKAKPEPSKLVTREDGKMYQKISF